MASRAPPVLLPCLDATEPERPPPPALVSDLLEEIFLRVACPADLARASAACVAFRDLIRSPSFLRRYRSAHPPLLLGFVNAAGFHPVEATHPSAAVARGVAARTVDSSFVPHPLRGFYPHDIRDGRVLVVRHRDMRMQRRRRRRKHYLDIAVCDPVFQRYLLLPPITDDLLASVGLRNKDLSCSGASLIPSGGTGTGTEEETSFSVICWMFPKTRFGVFIFSTSSAHWAAVKSISWADLGLSEEDGNSLELDYSRQCVYGCFYWKVYLRDKLIKLDMDTMEFSKYDLPPAGHNQRSVAIVESGEGKVAMFSTIGKGSVEYYTFTQNGAEKSPKWHLKSTITLPDHCPSRFFIAGQAEGFVFLTYTVEEQDTEYFEYFTLEVKSCNIERACRTSGRIMSCPYFGFPPFMSTRRIRGHGQDSLALV